MLFVLIISACSAITKPYAVVIGMAKEDVLKLKDAAENYVNNVKESRGEKVEKKEEKK